ncbi:MAG: hypothetical protein J6R88_05870 [Clostridia bacterium]|nr:hypothetical protein [Clostridia bacterium]
MKNKNYFKALFTNAVFYAGFVLGFILITAYIVCYEYGIIKWFAASSADIVAFVDVLIALALAIFVLAGFRKLKTETVTFSEALVGFLLALVLGGIYLIIFVENHVVSSALTTVIALAIASVVMVLRAKYFDHKYDVLPSNVNVKSYYKAFFKTYGVVAIIFAVATCATMVIIELSNVVGYILAGGSIKVAVSIALVCAFVLFLILFFTRLRTKEMGIVDVLTFAIIGVVLGIIPVAFMVAPVYIVLVVVAEAVIFALGVVLTILIIKNTHVYTDEENKELENAQTGVASYLKALIDKTNIIVAIGVSAIISAFVTFIEGINILSVLMSVLKLEGEFVIAVGVVVVAVLFVLFVLADVNDYRITEVDSALNVWNVTFVTLTILHFALFGGGIDLHFAFAFGGLVLGLILFFVRSRFVHYGEVVFKTAEPCACVEPVVEVVATEETTNDAEEVTEEAVEEVATVPTKLKRINVKKIFENYVRTGDNQLKENYSAIKNAFYSYGVHSRLTKTRENFSKKGASMSKVKPEKALHLQAKLQVRGKFVKLYINVDPTTLDAKYFRHKDVSSKSPDQATLLKIRSKLTLKRALELIDMLAEKEGFTKKKKFEPVDYTKVYTDENLSYMEKLGFDYIVKNSVTLYEVKGYNPEFADKVVKTLIVDKPDRYIYDEVSLDAICDNFAEGEVADLEAMRAKGLIKINANKVTVVASPKLSKKLTIVASEIEPNAIMMVAIAGGEVTQLVEA